ncbi:MAG: ParB/RepB/Spo0J family partition protein [Sphingomonas pseudosanguinis]|uniref:ParB/RepB/Spo0J family partition protein n=1 Tax=Sphingomonas pseudosanguinis TaxID=413712 RepID=UPI003919ABC4
MTISSIPLDKLVISPLNVRQTDDDHDTSDLEASIQAHGLLSHLIVHKIPKPRGNYGVLAGGRRLRALQRLRDRSAIAADYLVDVEIRDPDEATATEISVIENTARVALPPAEEFAAFAKLAADGADIAAIAKRFGTTELHVKQRMRLGQLHPDILAALAAGHITLDVAKAYASTSDLALQKRVFDQRLTHDYEVRAALKRDLVNAGVDRMLNLVTMQRYVDAGGQAEEDFFSTGEGRILNVDLLKQLYDVRLADERADLRLPTNVTLQFDHSGIGALVERADDLTEAEDQRLIAIDARCDEIADRLDEIADLEMDGVSPKWVALAGENQDEVTNLIAEEKRLEREADGIRDGGLPDGPIIAVAEIASGHLRVRGFYRPMGWRPAPVGGVESSSPASTATIAPAGGADEKPVISAFRQDRAAYSGVYRQPEDVARQEHGLTKDAVEAMRSHHRAMLSAAIMRESYGHRYGARFLVFVLARGMFSECRKGQFDRETAADLGIHDLPSRAADPAQVLPDLTDQPSMQILRKEIEWLRGRDWMVEADPAIALHMAARAGHADIERASALIGVNMLARSLDATGFVMPVQYRLACLLGLSGRVREFFTPDAAFFARLSKNEKLKAIRAVDEALVKRVSNLGADDLSTAAALIMTGSPAAAEQFGMSREACQRAKGWVPAYLSFEGADADLDEEEAA